MNVRFYLSYDIKVPFLHIMRQKWVNLGANITKHCVAFFKVLALN